MNLEETVEALAKQHNTLERACRKNTGVGPEVMAEAVATEDNDSEEEEEEEEEENAEFFDAISEHQEEFAIPTSESLDSFQSQTSSEQSFSSEDGAPLIKKTSNKLHNEELSADNKESNATISETISVGTFGVSAMVNVVHFSTKYCQQIKIVVLKEVVCDFC